ncbi:MAG: histidine phosphatase family protein [candidate division KSB1 bacterium]|nr:histidine phosphatase family protein [candidate division KSB1 bacterium]MDZ7369197.1 histidine phosphatase family protein [candidate division KSB1 bacterium]MDZ7407194.1 histidine phosphatase family protein [candidate division KSB1 bacterium]
MKTISLKIFLVAIFLAAALPAQAQPTVYLVRHADKLAKWYDDDVLDDFHPLSAEGETRAKKLADQFASGTVAAIFSSRTTRALHTALPLSQKLSLPVEVAEACMDTAAIAGFYKRLSQRFKSGQAVVLVSHSNIIPYFLIKAGLAQSCFKEIGIKASSPGEWLLIEGYDNIWKIEKLFAPRKNCEGFAVMKF